MDFKSYLESQNAAGTVKRYLREIDKYQTQIKDHETANYSRIMAYIGKQRQAYKNPQTVACSLYAIKKYYTYLQDQNIRKDNPAQSIKLRDNKRKDIQLQDLFSNAELEQLLERKERYSLLKNRNQIIISLLIYQALTSGEITNLQLDAINLEQGTIQILPGRKTNGRTLNLTAKQVYLIMQYLASDREKLLKKATQIVLIGKLGKAITTEEIGYLIETKKHLFKDRKLNPKTIRQSVITNLLKQDNDLRKVQVFAGHKYPSATEKYKQNQLEELKKEVLKYHPLQ